MKNRTSIGQQWIVVRLGDDLNWWIERTSEDDVPVGVLHGVLDPRQVAHLRGVLQEYTAYGLCKQQLVDAFQTFELQAEVSEDLLRLAPSDEGILGAEPELFAVPVITGDGEGPYYELLDAISAARVRKLNMTHRYVHNCDEFEMYEELSALDMDRYFNSEIIHAFDEISEILQWSPAEWDGSDSAS